MTIKFYDYYRPYEYIVQIGDTYYFWYPGSKGAIPLNNNYDQELEEDPDAKRLVKGCKEVPLSQIIKDFLIAEHFHLKEKEW